MSLILDALKKSEAERQRGQVPNLLSPLPATPRHVQTNKKSFWPWLVLVLMIAAAMFAYFTMKKPGVDSSVIVTVPETTAPVQTVATPSAPITAPVTVVEVAKPVAVIEKPDIVPVIPVTATPVETTLTADLPEAASTDERIASLSEMSAEQRQQLPALKLSMHVFSPEAGKRFAIIDGQRVNEGSVLGPAVVEQIRQDGVVLSVQGQSYLLPRP
jgi:general secretion pathway protein B